MSQILIVNASIVTMDSQRRVLEGGSLLIDGDRLAAVGVGTLEKRPEMEVIDAQDKIILPGLINTHAHSSQQLVLQPQFRRCTGIRFQA